MKSHNELIINDITKRKLKASWTLELDNELKNIYGINKVLKNNEFISEKEFKI